MGSWSFMLQPGGCSQKELFPWLSVPPQERRQRARASPRPLHIAGVVLFILPSADIQGVVSPHSPAGEVRVKSPTLLGLQLCVLPAKTRGAWEETAPHPQEAAGRTSHPSHRGSKARGGSGSLPGGIFGLEPTPSPTSSAGRAAGGTEISTLPWIKGWAHSSFPNEGITTECA